jgi:ribosome-binding factor A
MIETVTSSPPVQDCNMSKRTQKTREKQSDTNGPSQRMLRVGEMMRHKVAALLSRGEIHDEVLAKYVITVSEVRLSPDLRLATVYVMPLGGKDVDIVLAALERNKKFIRGEITDALSLKFAPDIRFRRDETFDEAERIDKLLSSERVRRDTQKPNE